MLFPLSAPDFQSAFQQEERFLLYLPGAQQAYRGPAEPFFDRLLPSCNVTRFAVAGGDKGIRCADEAGNP